MSLLGDMGTAIKNKLLLKQDTITGGATTITSSNLTASRALTSDTNGKVAVSATTSTELGYLSGVTSSVQTQINGKQPTLGFTPIQQGTGTGQSANTVSIGWSAASKLRVQVDATDFGTYFPIDISGNAATATKLATAVTINGINFDGTANITVVDSTKAPLASPALTGTPTAPTATVGTNTTQIATTAFVLANRLQDVSFTAGTKLEALAASEVSFMNATSYIKKKEISVGTGGTITVSFRLKTGFSPYAVYGQIYVNGVAVGTVRATTSTAYVTFTEDITVAAGALVQLYVKFGSTDYYAYADQFKILVATPSTSIVLLN